MSTSSVSSGGGTRATTSWRSRDAKGRCAPRRRRRGDPRRPAHRGGRSRRRRGTRAVRARGERRADPPGRRGGRGRAPFPSLMEVAMPSQSELDALCVNTIRTLSIDAVQKAKSGHPATPMALAPLVYTLWNRVMRFDPRDPICVVSMPSWELFDHQPQEYRDSVLPPSVKARIAVEQASTFGWERYVGSEGRVIGMRTFGASAPLKELQQR